MTLRALNSPARVVVAARAHPPRLFKQPRPAVWQRSAGNTYDPSGVDGHANQRSEAHPVVAIRRGCRG